MSETARSFTNATASQLGVRRLGVLAVLTVLGTLVILVSPRQAQAQEADDITTPRAVVERGLSALVKLQQPDGSFANHIGLTSLAGMALLAGGHTASRGDFRVQSDLALRYVLAHADPSSGYLGNDNGSMYTHGLATLYLAESSGMAPALDFREDLERAMQVIYRAQNPQGGWRYQTVPLDADLSVTACLMMALRGAHSIDLDGEQTKDAVSRAVAYVRSLAKGDGTFLYQLAKRDHDSAADEVPRCAAACMALFAAGVTDGSDETLGPALRFLRAHVVEHLEGSPRYYWYGQYYAAQAMYQSPDPTDWVIYWTRAMPLLTRMQRSDGLWPAVDAIGADGPQANVIYSTVMALIILQIPNNYLPILQR